ncbi:dissimilatory sulfite reductase D family protein [Archaeoglobus sp.]
MVEYTEEDKQKVLEQLGKKTWKIPELAKILKMDKKVVRKIVQDLIEEGVAGYWSSGSTTYVSTKEHIEELEKKRAEG